MQRDLSACVKDWFNGFEIAKDLRKKEIRDLFYPIDIVYKPISNIKQTIDYYFSKFMRNAYQETFSKGKRGVKNSSAEQWYGCNKFFVERKKNWKHLKIKSSMSRIIYKFNDQNVQTFEDNYKFMGEVPFSIYFDFETTCGKKSFWIWQWVWTLTGLLCICCCIQSHAKTR